MKRKTQDGRIIKGWDVLGPRLTDDSDPRAQLQAFGHFKDAVDRFFRHPDMKDVHAAIQMQGVHTAEMQAFGIKGHMPDLIKDIVARFPEYKDFDTAYESVFDVIDYTGSRKDGFRIRDVENGLTFAAVPTGSKAKIYSIAGADVSVPFELMGAGLDLPLIYFEDEDYYSIEDALVAFRAAEFRKRADVHYALIEAIPTTQNTAWAGATGDAEAVRDIKTINSACGSIISDLADTGANFNEGTEFTLLYQDNAANRRRVAQALNYTGQVYAGSPKLLSYNVRPRTTTLLSSATNWYIALPGRKNKSGNRMNLRMFSQLGIVSYSSLMTGWSRYGAGIGEPKQIRRLATS